VGELLGSFLEDRGVRAQMERTGVLDEWTERVGEAIAGVTRPRSLSDTTLFVEVRSSAWLMELDMMKREILLRLNQGRGEAAIEKIVFVLAERSDTTATRGEAGREPTGLRPLEPGRGR
jgi:predicted nucleic acid-binding Zn ribbon protein